jgi:hypothetical protein
MGISHPLSDEYDALRGAVLSPDTTPPSSPLAHRHLLEHEVTRMDTLAGIAIKYGVEVFIIHPAIVAFSALVGWLVVVGKSLYTPPRPRDGRGDLMLFAKNSNFSSFLGNHMSKESPALCVICFISYYINPQT